MPAFQERDPHQPGAVGETSGPRPLPPAPVEAAPALPAACLSWGHWGRQSGGGGALGRLGSSKGWLRPGTSCQSSGAHHPLCPVAAKPERIVLV